MYKLKPVELVMPSFALILHCHMSHLKLCHRLKQPIPIDVIPA